VADSALVRALACVILALLLTAPAALASPGGGSSGFGGGGGGGGGGYVGGGGTGAGGSASWSTILVFVAIAAIFVAWSAFTAVRYRRRRRARVERVRLAAAEAADDDAGFDSEAVAGTVADLHRSIVRAWTDRDRDALAGLLGADLMVEWRRRLDDFDRKGWHNVTEILDGPAVEYVGLTNRAADADDRVVVRVTARLRDYVEDARGHRIRRTDSESETTELAEYWTLGKRDSGWILLSIEQDAEGRHQLDSPLVASPWGDEARMRDESLTELATADAVPAAALAEITPLDIDGDARAAALDLSLVDARYGPDVLEAAARRAVDAWAEAVDGDDAPLEAVADRAAVDALLYPGDPARKTRLVVRGPRLTNLRITGLRAPTMTVEADVSGRRYREDRDTLALLEGSRDRDAKFAVRWTLQLTDDADAPWRLVAA
jgi:predicted lipid-binding transport protein (Tim44 family)